MGKLISEIRESAPMLYWSTPTKMSVSQQQKLEEILTGKNYFMTLKRDGIFARYSKLSNQDFKFQSRVKSKTTGTYTERTENVPHLVEELNDILPDGTVVIGEIVLPIKGSISSDVGSVLNCLPEKSLSRQKKIKLHYYIFDIIAFEGRDLRNSPAEIRMSILQGLSKKKTAYNYLEFAIPIFNNFPSEIEKWLKKGHEGAVLMKKDSKYVEKRSSAWQTIKIKKSIDTIDLVIMGFSAPIKEYTGKYPRMWSYWRNLKTGELVEGNYYELGGFEPVSTYYFYNLPSGLILGAYYGDELLKIATVDNLTDELRQEIKLNSKNFLGSVVEVSAMSIDIEKRSLRHPNLIRLRKDKDPRDCLYEEIFIESR